VTRIGVQLPLWFQVDEHTVENELASMRVEEFYLALWFPAALLPFLSYYAFTVMTKKRGRDFGSDASRGDDAVIPSRRVL
jgi:hypothetical protein